MTYSLACLSALAHEGRLSLFRRLVTAGPEGMAAGQLAREQEINFSTASAQLAQLAQAGLVLSERQGRSIVYRADYDRIGALLVFLMKDCCQGRREILEPLAELATRDRPHISQKGTAP